MTDTVYPKPISTSLPKDIQDTYIRSIKGLERVKILKYGYAVEYDFINPKSLKLIRVEKHRRSFFSWTN